MFKDHNRNTRTRWEIRSKLTIKTSEDVIDLFIANFNASYNINFFIYLLSFDK